MLVAFLAALLATLAGTLLALEAQAWAPHLSRLLLHRTLAKLPAELSEAVRRRWAEELEADLAAFADRPLGGLAFALRLWRRGGRELAAALEPRRLRRKKRAVRSSSGRGEPVSTAGDGTDDDAEYRYYPVTMRVGPVMTKTYYRRYRVAKREGER